MKLRKVTINGKTYYEEIIDDNDAIEPEVIEPKKKKGFFQRRRDEKEERKREMNQERVEREKRAERRKAAYENYEDNANKQTEKKQENKGIFSKESWKRDWNEFIESMKGIGANISSAVTGKKKNWYEDTPSSRCTTDKLVKILPYMKEEDIHDIARRIVNGDEEFKDIDYAAIMPFMNDEDCDALFMKTLRDGDTISIKMVHFVSEDCLSALVEAYIDGRYPSLDVDSLYPFLNSEDVKKLFYYELRKKK